jgi:hypothetical protein
VKQSTHLPNLQVVSVETLVLHETVDERRVERLARRLDEENRLKNPPVVTHVSHSNLLMVLDGTNRVSAFKLLGIPHIVVQVISYKDPGVELDAWNHVVAGLPEEQFQGALGDKPHLHLEECSINDARQALAIGDALAYVVLKDAVRLIRDRVSGNEIQLLNDLVGTYKGRADVYRASNDDFAKQSASYSDITALVVFPSFRPSDLVALVRRGEMLPSGITRHIIPERALRINIPLSVLKEDRSLAEKEAWLDQWWRDRLTLNAVRFYAESTFLFDE